MTAVDPENSALAGTEHTGYTLSTSTFRPYPTPTLVFYVPCCAPSFPLHFPRVRVCLVARYEKVFDVRAARLPKTLRDGFSITRWRCSVVKSSYCMEHWRTFPSRSGSRGEARFWHTVAFCDLRSQSGHYENVVVSRESVSAVRVTCRFTSRAIFRIVDIESAWNARHRGNFMSKTFIRGFYIGQLLKVL